MLWLIIGGIASGKSLFAERLAASVGRAGIQMHDLHGRPAPGMGTSVSESAAGAAAAGGKGFPDKDGFAWLRTEADASLASKLRAVNRESNPFRSDRVVVVDSLSGWLRDRFLDAGPAGTPPSEPIPSSVDLALEELMGELLSFQGKLIVVSEEPALGLFRDAWAEGYAYRLAGAQRRLSERSRKTYRLTAGIASEVKGYRVAREEFES